jgi:hypothetical protein
MQIVEDWVEPFRKGVLYDLRDGRIRAWFPRRHIHCSAAGTPIFRVFLRC